MSGGDPFADEFNPAAARLIQPIGQEFQMYVPPRYEDHYAINEYEKLTAGFFSRLLRCAGIFVDVGADAGFFSLLAIKSNPSANIIALEPTPSSCEILRRNLASCAPASVEIHQAAASSASGPKQFVISAASDNCSFYEHPNAPTIG